MGISVFMAQAANQKHLKILIAEDSAPDRMILESIVTQVGHTAISVEDGVQAVEAYKKERPDIVLLDVLMPNMGGMDTAREIRKISAGELVPIVFLTSLSDNESLVECLDAGGDDFASKPYNRVVIQSKIKAFSRMREMHQTLAEQKSQIEANNRHLIQEQRVAKQVFDKIAHSGCLDLSNIRYYMSPLAVFNGDVLVSEVSPSGSIVMLLGDFTGHGLPAAIGSMPLATTFYGMVRKGFSMADILREINAKLNQILPVGFFCCATCIDVNFTKQRLRVWNGGLPDCYLYRADTDNYEKIQSSHLPLGVLSHREFKAETQRIRLEEGDRFYMWSDGICEARNGKGEMFGEERLHRLMDRRKGQDILFDEILGQVHNHIGTSDKNDDISLVEILMEEVDLVVHEDISEKAKQGQLKDWKMDFRVESSSLKDYDPLPLLLNILSEIPGLRRHSAMLYTVMSEMFNNALDHGILGMASDQKLSPEGFVAYYEDRRKKLSSLHDDYMIITLAHQYQANGGLLLIRVKDSGEGFDFEARESRKQQVSQPIRYHGEEVPEEKPNYFGRGLTLIDSICEKLIIHPPGNDIEAHFRWENES